MPVVTTPVQVSADPEFRQSRSEFNPMEFQVGDQLYQVLVAAQDVQRRLGVFKRAVSDDGGDWARKDDAGSPDAGTQLGYLYPVLNASTGVIRVFYILTGDSLFHYCDFDTNTDTWGTPSSGASYGATSGAFNRSFLAYRKSNGDYVGLFNTSTNLYYFTVIAGVWSSVTSILTALATLAGNGVVDGADGFGFFTHESGTIVSYRYLDASFTLSGATALTGSQSNKRSTAVAFGSGIAVGYTLTDNDVVVRISPSFTAPVFTGYTIYTAASVDESTSYASIAVGLASDLNLFFVVTNFNSDPIVDEFRQSTFDGVSTWSAPTLFYDETAHPPADTVPDPLNQFLHTGDFRELPQGWSGASTMETIDSDDTQWCTGFFLEPPAAPTGQTLELTKIVVGGNNNASDFFIQATGNNSTISGNGHVGPSNVNPGTYVLSEVAFPPLIWANDNQTWAADNNSWTQNYVQGVWNCGPAEMPTPNSVVVPAGSPGPPAVRALQVSATPSYKGSLAGNKSYFQIGTDLYEVLCSGSQLGVFKRAASSAGGTWAEQDAAHAPTSQSGYFFAVVNGTKIGILQVLTGLGSMKLVEFNTTTNQYGTPSSTLSVPVGSGNFGFTIKASTYVAIGSGSVNTYYVTNTGGTWSAVNNIIAAPPVTVYAAFADPLNNIRFFGNRVSAHLDMWLLDSSFTLSVTVHNFTNNLDFTKGSPSIVTISATSYAVGYITTLFGHPFTVTVVTNINVSPVYTPANVYSQPSTDEEVSLGTLVLDSGGNLTALFVRRNIVSSPVVNEIDRSTIGGGIWPAYTTVYDAVANPPAHGVSDVAQIIGALDPIDLTAGWTAGTTLTTLQPASTLTGEFVENVTPTSAVACFITNTFVGPTPPPPPPPATGTCRTILHLWQLAASPQVEITTDRASDWNNGGHEGNKFYQGLKLDADTFGQPKTLMIRDADTGTLHVLQPGVVNHAGRQVIPYSFQTPFTAHMVKDEPQDLVPWRKFGVTYVFELTPESVQTWITQFTAHGLKGYQHIARIEAAYASTAQVTLTITSYDGTSPAPITLPSTAGAYQKLLLTLTLNKGQLYRYAAQSTAPFQLYLEDWILWIGMWGRSDAYLPYRSLGGSLGDKASI